MNLKRMATSAKLRKLHPPKSKEQQKEERFRNLLCRVKVVIK